MDYETGTRLDIINANIVEINKKIDTLLDALSKPDKKKEEPVKEEK